MLSKQVKKTLTKNILIICLLLVVSSMGCQINNAEGLIVFGHETTAVQLVDLNTYIYFDSDFTAENITVASTYISFTDFTMNSIQTDSYATSCINSNMTITHVDFDDYLEFSVVGVGTQCFYTQKRPVSVEVNGLSYTSYSYSVGWVNVSSAPSTGIVKVLFSSTSETVPTDYYYLSYTHTVLNITGYDISTSKGWVYASASQDFAGLGQVDFGVRAWVLHSTDDDPTVLVGATEPQAIVSRASAGEGLQSTSVAVPSTTLVMGLNSIQVNVYVRFDGGDWLTFAVFVSDLLVEKAIVGGDWSFNYYTVVSNTSTTTSASLYWGDQTRLSGIGGVVFIHPLPQEVALNFGLQGNLVGMLFYPYTYIICDLFYALILLFIGGNLYLRHKRFEIILIMFILWGSTSGIGLLIPMEAYRVIYIILLLAIAAVIYKILR